MVDVDRDGLHTLLFPAGRGRGRDVSYAAALLPQASPRTRLRAMTLGQRQTNASSFCSAQNPRLRDWTAGSRLRAGCSSRTTGTRRGQRRIRTLRIRSRTSLCGAAVPHPAEARGGATRRRPPPHWTQGAALCMSPPPRGPIGREPGALCMAPPHPPVRRGAAVSGRRRGAAQCRSRSRAVASSRLRAAPPLRWRLAERSGAGWQQQAVAGRAKRSGWRVSPRPPVVLFLPLSCEPLPARVPRVQHEVQRWPGEVRRR